MKLTPEQVRELLDYDPETGILRWRKRLLRKGLERIDAGWNTRFVGKQAGTVGRHGHVYLIISYGLPPGTHLAAHRLAWVHYYGEWPTEDIDHINGVPNDNRIPNLRLATNSQNAANMKVSIVNTSGAKGVSWDKKRKKWVAYLNKEAILYFPYPTQTQGVNL